MKATDSISLLCFWYRIVRVHLFHLLIYNTYIIFSKKKFFNYFGWITDALSSNSKLFTWRCLLCMEFKHTVQTISQLPTWTIEHSVLDIIYLYGLVCKLSIFVRASILYYNITESDTHIYFMNNNFQSVSTQSYCPLTFLKS